MTQACIVAAHDGHSRCAVRAAAGLAGLLDARLVIAEVYRHEPGHEALNARRFEAASAGLQRAMHGVREDLETERIALPATDMAGALVGLAAEREAVAIVLGPDQRGHVTHEVLHAADCPIVVTPSEVLLLTDRPARVGVAFDGTVGSHFALAAAEHVARQAGAALELIGVAAHAHEATALTGLLATEVTRIAETGLTVRPLVLEGRPGVELRHAAERLDLLCCGARARPELLSPMLGSVSSVLVAEPPCPVLVVPPRTRRRAGEPLGLTRAGA